MPLIDKQPTPTPAGYDPCPFCAPHRAAGYQPTTCEDCCGSGFIRRECERVGSGVPRSIGTIRNASNRKEGNS